jgi:hypothetical protein
MWRTSGSTPSFSAYATMSRNAFSWAAMEGWPGSSAQAKWDQRPVILTVPACSAVRAAATSSGQGPHPAHRHIDVGLDRLAPGPARRPQPAHHPAAEPGRPQGERLLRRRGAQPGRPGLQRGTGAGHRPVPVRIGFDDGHELRATRPRAKYTHVGAQCGEVDLCTGSQGRCLIHRAQSLRGVRQTLRAAGRERPVTKGTRRATHVHVSGGAARVPDGRRGPGRGCAVRP